MFSQFINQRAKSVQDSGVIIHSLDDNPQFTLYAAGPRTKDKNDV